MEYLKFAFSGINILPSMMICIVILYWIMAIIGSFDVNLHFHHKIDLHFGESHGTHNSLDHGHDSPLEALASTSFPLKVLRFLNIGYVPITIHVTILSLSVWILTMMTYYMNIAPKSLLGVGVFFINLFIAFLVTKIITEPFKGLFLMLDNREKINIVGEFCTLKYDIDENGLGLAELNSKHDIVINVKTVSGKMAKGETAYILEKHNEDNVYIIQKSI